VLTVYEPGQKSCRFCSQNNNFKYQLHFAYRGLEVVLIEILFPKACYLLELKFCFQMLKLKFGFQRSGSCSTVPPWWPNASCSTRARSALASSCAEQFSSTGHPARQEGRQSMRQEKKRGNRQRGDWYFHSYSLLVFVFTSFNILYQIITRKGQLTEM
jgi:hypothetical protein